MLYFLSDFRYARLSFECILLIIGHFLFEKMIKSMNFAISHISSLKMSFENYMKNSLAQQRTILSPIIEAKYAEHQQERNKFY